MNNINLIGTERFKSQGWNRRDFLSLSLTAAAASAIPTGMNAAVPQRASPAKKGLGELFSSVPCPWTAENPRHDHQLIFPLSGHRLLLVWCEYYVTRPSHIFRTTYSHEGSTGDAAPCRISGRISTDGGRSWSGKITLQDNIGADNVKHPNILRLASGDILFSYTVRDIARKDVSIFLKRSADECETWSGAVRISPPGGVYFTNADHIFLHTSGRIILPCHWGEFYGAGDKYQAFCFYSDDNGITWKKSRNGVNLPKRGAEEPGIVELRDGTLLSLMRTTLGKIYQAHSKDRGETWSEANETVLPSPSVANCLKRIPGTGDLVFIWNNATPYALVDPTSNSYHYPRNPLTAAISKDEGNTWQNFKTIVDRKGYISAYPSLTFVGNEALVTYYHASESASRDCDVRLKIFSTEWFYS